MAISDGTFAILAERAFTLVAAEAKATVSCHGRDALRRSGSRNGSAQRIGVAIIAEAVCAGLKHVSGARSGERSRRLETSRRGRCGPFLHSFLWSGGCKAKGGIEGVLGGSRSR